MDGVSVRSTGPVFGETKLLSKANVRPLFYCAIAVWGAVLYGYDGTYFAGILAMPRFLRDFGELNSSGEYIISSGNQSLLASIVQAGELVGSLAAGFLGQWAGRKGAFLGASALVCLGTILQLILVGSIPLLTVGRFVLGSGVGIISNATPLYLSEVANKNIRGAVVSCWQLFLAIGQVIGACVDQGTKGIDSTAAYRIPIGLNFLIALIIVAGMAIIPESPRWLISKHRDEQALASLRKINKDQPDFEAVVDVEYKSFIDSRKEEEELSGQGGWGNMFSSPIERRKLFLVWGILVGQQIGGVQFIFSYTTTFFKAVGLTDEFLITIIVDVIEVFGVLCSFLVVNRIGRRPLLIYTSIPMFISLFVCGALGTIDNRTETQNRTIAAMICLYVFFFNLAWGPLAWVVASELSSGRNKTRVMALSTASFWLVAWAVTFTLPYLFTNAGLGPQIGWIYGVGTLIALAFVFFYIPETRGRSLEDITEMFEAKLPALKWISYETQNERSKVDNSLAIVGGGHETSSDVDDSEDGKVYTKKTGGDRQKNATLDA